METDLRRRPGEFIAACPASSLWSGKDMWVGVSHASFKSGLCGSPVGGCREGTSEHAAAIAVLAPGAERVEREGKAEERDTERK